MKKPHIDAYGIDGKIVPAKSLSPKQIAELEKDDTERQKDHERALEAANKMMQPPAAWKTWARRLGIMAMLTPIAPIGACVVNHFYGQKPSPAAPVASAPDASTDKKEVRQVTKAPEKPTDWYFKPADLKKRDAIILDSLAKNMPSVMEKVKGHNQPVQFEVEIGGVLFKGLIVIEHKKGEKKGIVHLLFVGPPCEGECEQFHFEMHEEIPLEPHLTPVAPEEHTL